MSSSNSLTPDDLHSIGDKSREPIKRAFSFDKLRVDKIRVPLPRFQQAPVAKPKSTGEMFLDHLTKRCADTEAEALFKARENAPESRMEVGARTASDVK